MAAGEFDSQEASGTALLRVDLVLGAEEEETAAVEEEEGVQT